MWLHNLCKPHENLLRLSHLVNTPWRGSINCLSWNAVKYFQLMMSLFHLTSCKEGSTWYGMHVNRCISLIFMNWKVYTMVLPIKILMAGKYCTWMDPGIPTQKPQHSRSELSALVSCVGLTFWAFQIIAKFISILTGQNHISLESIFLVGMEFVLIFEILMKLI